MGAEELAAAVRAGRVPYDELCALVADLLTRRLPGLLSDREIRALALDHGMIQPFIDGLQQDGVISYGLSSYGYDLRLDDEFLVVTDAFAGVIDPKHLRPDAVYVRRDSPHGEPLCVAPHSFVLAQTIETLAIPRDLTAVCLGKSTYARCGVVVNTTPAEAEWRGHLTLEISNTAPVPVILYPGEGIAQMLFWRAADACEVSYADRRGRYQDQQRVTPPFVRSTREKDAYHG